MNFPRRDSQKNVNAVSSAVWSFQSIECAVCFFETIDWFSNAIIPKYGKSYAIFKIPNQQEWPRATYNANSNVCFTNRFKTFVLISLLQHYCQREAEIIITNYFSCNAYSHREKINAEKNRVFYMP